VSAPNAPGEAARPRSAAAKRVLVVAGAVALGLALQQVIAARLDAIQELSRHDLLGARVELATVFRVVAVLVFGATGGAGLSMMVACRKALEVGSFPPPGIWSWGAARIATGPRARTLARIALVLGAALVALSAAASGMLWIFAARLLACRAGVG
jgi:hypothetical protein